MSSQILRCYHVWVCAVAGGGHVVSEIATLLSARLLPTLSPFPRALPPSCEPRLPGAPSSAGPRILVPHPPPPSLLWSLLHPQHPALWPGDASRTLHPRKKDLFLRHRISGSPPPGALEVARSGPLGGQAVPVEGVSPGTPRFLPGGPGLAPSCPPGVLLPPLCSPRVLPDSDPLRSPEAARRCELELGTLHEAPPVPGAAPPRLTTPRSLRTDQLQRGKPHWREFKRLTQGSIRQRHLLGSPAPALPPGHARAWRGPAPGYRPVPTPVPARGECPLHVRAVNLRCHRCLWLQPACLFCL